MHIGIDIGSLFIKGVKIDSDSRITDKQVVLHKGSIEEKTFEVIEKLASGTHPDLITVTITGKAGEKMLEDLQVQGVDPVQSEVMGVRQLYGKVNNILHLGGSSTMLIYLDPKGDLIDFSTNTGCAAGTGSFLDEQATRMQMDYVKLDELEVVDEPPPIATRCAVFAKTDLIHRQQEGYNQAQLWSGLCKGMTETVLQTLLKGHKLSGVTAVTGGVAKHKGIIKFMRQKLGDGLRVSDDAQFTAALGAALSGEGMVLSALLRARRELQARGKQEKEVVRRKPLVLKKTKYPDFSVPISYTNDDDTEVRIHLVPNPGSKFDVYMGIDVGSTSTKAVLTTLDNKALMDVYRKTAGAPITAAKLLFKALQEAQELYKIELNVLGVGTTGSGRKIVGSVVGADLVVNEITAHVKGATTIDPEVETIFEIGGQDSKYMRVKNGQIADANMNYVCAAGTGSFVEELGRKLGFSVFEIGDAVMGIAPPVTSDRCTVFMEQDAINLFNEGFSRNEVIAAILYSVIANYRTMVVGNRPISKRKLMFQGATARNKGLVAAIENMLDVEVVVSPYCHVMGAYGAALMARGEVERKGSSEFRGMDLANRDVKVYNEVCPLCTNHCVITYAEVEGMEGRAGFGYMCGRDDSDTGMKRVDEFGAIRFRRAQLGLRSSPRGKTRIGIGIPRSLTTWTYAPLFKTLFTELGMDVIFSKETNQEIVDLGDQNVASDFCFPMKVAHGHVAWLANKKGVDAIFVPSMIEEKRNDKTSRTRFCPYVESLPSVVKKQFEDKPFMPPILSPIMDFNATPKEMGRRLRIGLAPVADVDEEQAARAWQKAVAAYKAADKKLVERGLELVREVEESGEKAIVILGRPYNTLDNTVSQGIPFKIAEKGFKVIHMDMLPFEPDTLGKEFSNMYWYYGQKILSAAKFVAKHPNLYALYLSSFNCGPDSFVQGFVEETMGEKQMLILELDEHGSDGGYQTRLEAFLDVLAAQPVPKGVSTVTPVQGSPDKLKGRILWIPPMHVLGSRFFAAVLNGHGIESRAMPETDDGAHTLGKLATRGAECTPMALTLGTFVKAMKDSGEPTSRHALFMPTATGPCRFGSYALAQHIALEHMGYKDIPIISPDSENSYAGIPAAARTALWDAVLSADFLYKMVLKTRPYEVHKGQCNMLMEKWAQRIERAMENRKSPLPELVEAAREFNQVPVTGERKPLVGVVGEIYVRNEAYANARVIESIEQYGGEAWLSPIGEWILYTVWSERNLPRIHRSNLLSRIVGEFSNLFIERKEKAYHEALKPYLADRMEPPIEQVLHEGLNFIPKEFEGESVLTIGRAVRFMEEGASMVVNASPFGCMHGHISGSIFEKLIRKYERPIVTMFYDDGVTNDLIKSYIAAAAKKLQKTGTSTKRRKAEYVG